jgi:uridine phosphorylase
VADNIITGEKFLAGAGHNVAVDIALEACVIIDSMDAMKRKHNSRNWHPGLV